MPLLLILLAIPAIEIALFIVAGDELGIGNTVLLTILTAVIGIAIVRMQGTDTIMSMRAKVARDETPKAEVFDAICLILAGVLLLLPGFFTDGIGFLLLMPPIRKSLRARVEKLPDGMMQSEFQSSTFFKMRGDAKKGENNSKKTPDVIEGEYKDITNDNDPSK